MQREPRKVSFMTIWGLLKQKPIHLIFAVVFTLIPFFVGSVFLLVSSLIDSDVPEVEYDLIRQKGKQTTAVINHLMTQTNVTINNEHPTIIKYSFNADNDLAVDGVFRTLNPQMVSKMNVGDTISILYLGSGSMIIGLEPFEFPFDIVTSLLLPFLIIGSALFLLLYVRIRKEINLYKFGVVVEAEVVSMAIKNGLPISGIGQGVVVDYQYKTSLGEQRLGQSFTNNHALLNSKKQGDRIKIFVSETREKDSCLIPKTESIRNNWGID